MKLSKIYCNNEGFKNTTFNLSGLNVIYADVQSDYKEKKNSHCLGKTKLAELIDFMLLKRISDGHFLLKKDKYKELIFGNHVFYLEIELNNGEYLTIKRGVKANTKISFSINEKRSKGYAPPLNWAHESAPIDRAKDLLSEYLSFDFYHNKDYNYRMSTSYSLRTQNDFKDVFKLNKFAGSDINWKPFMFDLLGFDGRLLKLKYENDNRINDIDLIIKSYKRDFSVKAEDRDNIIAQKEIAESEYLETEERIDSFNFYQQDKKSIELGVDEIENEISLLNSESYRLNYEIDRLHSSLKNKFSFNLEKVIKVFNEANVYFQEQLVRDYEELISFNNKLSHERNKHLKSAIDEKTQELEIVNNKLEELNIRRESLLSYLTDSDTFVQFKKYQKDLVKVE